MRILFLILICFNLRGQIDFPKFDDKAAHFYVSFSSAIIVGEITNQITDLQGLSSAIGGAFAITITLGKEYFYDRYLGLGVFSIDDIIVGCMGAITGAIVHRVIIDLIQRKKQDKFIKLNNAKRLLL